MITSLGEERAGLLYVLFVHLHIYFARVNTALHVRVYVSFVLFRIEPRHKKTCTRGFRPSKTQTGLFSYRD